VVGWARGDGGVDVFHLFLRSHLLKHFWHRRSSLKLAQSIMAKAGPSTSASTSQAAPKSQSEVDSDSSHNSPDSEDDIENVTPRRKDGLPAGTGQASTAQGKSLP